MPELSDVIIVENVSMRFNMPKEKVDSIKEYLIKKIKKQLKYEEFTALSNVSFSIKKVRLLVLSGLMALARVQCLK